MRRQRRRLRQLPSVPNSNQAMATVMASATSVTIVPPYPIRLRRIPTATAKRCLRQLPTWPTPIRPMPTATVWVTSAILHRHRRRRFGNPGYPANTCATTIALTSTTGPEGHQRQRIGDACEWICGDADNTKWLTSRMQCTLSIIYSRVVSPRTSEAAKCE